MEFGQRGVRDAEVADRVVAARAATDPVVADPVVADPVVADPVVTDPVVADPVAADPAVTDSEAAPVTDPVPGSSLSDDNRLRRRLSSPAALLALGTFALYSALALRLNALYETRGYDLGIFGQYAKAIAHGVAPTSQYRAKGAELSQAGPNLFGDHVSPVLYLLGPLYRLVPHVETLLVLQALLVAVSVWAVTGCAVRHLGTPNGGLIGGAYALSWGVQQLIGFDFHEVAFGMPLIALAIAAYLDGRYRAAALWAAALVLVKEDLGLTVFVFGLLLWRRDRRTARILCVLGPAAVAVALLVVIPHFAAADSLGRIGGSGADGGGFGALVKAPWLIPGKLFFPPVKLVTVLMLVLPTAFLALRSPLVLLAVPTLFWRFTADTPNYWGLSFHYSALLMPIVFLALVDALRRPATSPRLTGSRPYAWATRHAAPFALAAAVALSAFFPLHALAKPAFWQTPDFVRAEQQAVALVPPGALVASTGHFTPHLVDKATAYPVVSMAVLDLPDPVDWVIIDTADSDMAAPNGLRLIQQIRDGGFREVWRRDGIVVFRRG